jgi:ribose transport system substrate-binding protein
MRFSGRKGVLFVAAAVLIGLALPAYADDRLYIPVISKGFQHQFWQAVKLGAEKAAKQYNVEITFEGPPTEADIQPQVQMLVNAMAKNPAAICLAALDTNSVMDQLNEAVQRHIPIVGFDSGVPHAPKGAIYATAATNSYNAAGVAAEKMFAVIKDKIVAASSAHPVTIIDFNQDATSQSVTDRGKGFRDRLIQLITTQTKHGKADIKVKGNPAYISPDTPVNGKAIIIDVQVPASPKDTDATDSAQALLNRVQSDNVLGIFCSNEGTARAILSATNDGTALPTQYPGLVVIGFDAGKAQKAAVRNKYFLGAITQDPVAIGFHAVELAYKAVKGQKVQDVDTGAKFYTVDNMDQPEFGPLLYD